MRVQEAIPVPFAVSFHCQFIRKRLVRTVLIFTESSDQLSRATDRVPGLPASPGYVQ
ncbi:porin, partial [Escherichia coli]